MEPAINICHETPEFPDNNICQEEDLVVQASDDTSPCHYQGSSDEIGVPQLNTFEETPALPDDNICQEEDPEVQASDDTSPCHYQEASEESDVPQLYICEEEPTEEPKPPICLEPSNGSGNLVCQEPTEIPGNNNCQEEEPEQKMEPAINICHETPEFPDNNISQEEDLVVQASDDTSPCHYQECLDESDVPQLNTCEETPAFPDDNSCQEEELIVQASDDTSPCHYQASPKGTGTNTSQDEGSVKELSQEEEKDLKEESGTTTCQPKISQRKRVGPPTNEGNNTISLAEKYPEPGRYLKLGERIGEDPNGVIYNGWHRIRRVEVAIVVIKDQEKQKAIQKEIEVLEMVSGHGNIVDFYGAYYHQAPRTPSLPEGLWIATEFITGATLQDLIGTRKTLGERWISYICKKIITGLFHLQKKNVIHHDIKPGNILITSMGEVKIGEFGFATCGGKSSSTSGTITYSAPEVLANYGTNKLEYDHKADIWSLGIAAIEMAEGLSFSKLPQQRLIEKITRGPSPTLTPWGKWSDEFRFFISECLQNDPSRRPSARQLLSHPFIGEIWGERGVQKSIAQQLHRGMKH
uniref:Protein kinase domain-containing protein n=1 Tax=Xenopus tropicalis TaxID=8364 RepID=A0A803KCB9_XENTR